jgi:hypothetical protein
VSKNLEQRLDGIDRAIEDFEDYDVTRPCKFFPGSNEKIAFLCHRWALNQPLCLEEDNPGDDERQ